MRNTSEYSMSFSAISYSKDGEVIPIEVKAGNTATKSLNLFIENYKPSRAIKLITGNVGEVDSKITIPHYLAMFI